MRLRRLLPLASLPELEVRVREQAEVEDAGAEPVEETRYFVDEDGGKIHEHHQLDTVDDGTQETLGGAAVPWTPLAESPPSARALSTF